jgi:hypothetical protein
MVALHRWFGFFGLELKAKECFFSAWLSRLVALHDVAVNVHQAQADLLLVISKSKYNGNYRGLELW